MRLNLSCRLAAIATLVAAAPSVLAAEALVNYDNFAGTGLDASLWGPGYGAMEQRRAIVQGGLELGQRVVASKAGSTGTVAANHGVQFPNPAIVKEMAATIRARQLSTDLCAANPTAGWSAARIIGSYFNVGGRTEGSKLGDVLAQMRLERIAGSPLAAGLAAVVGRVDQCTSADCSSTLNLKRIDFGTVALGNPARVYLRWDAAANTFYFRRDSGGYVPYTYSLPDNVAPSVPFKSLQVRSVVENCSAAGSGLQGLTSAGFDDVKVNSGAAPLR